MPYRLGDCVKGNSPRLPISNNQIPNWVISDYPLAALLTLSMLYVMLLVLVHKWHLPWSGELRKVSIE